MSKLIQSCDLSRAMNALDSALPLHITTELTEMIQDLHPIATQEHCIPASAPTRIIVGANERLFQEKDLSGSSRTSELTLHQTSQDFDPATSKSFSVAAENKTLRRRAVDSCYAV